MKTTLYIKTENLLLPGEENEIYWEGKATCLGPASLSPGSPRCGTASRMFPPPSLCGGLEEWGEQNEVWWDSTKSFPEPPSGHGEKHVTSLLPGSVGPHVRVVT